MKFRKKGKGQTHEAPTQRPLKCCCDAFSIQAEASDLSLLTPFRLKLDLREMPRLLDKVYRKMKKSGESKVLPRKKSLIYNDYSHKQSSK